MKKNFLNAILFGGLIALSAGSFVACSDYDDDINGLQKQIDSVNTTLAALQTQVNAGRWVTTLTQIDGGFTVVFSDGSTYDIVNGQDGATGATGADGAAGSVVTIGTDGYWYIDGVKTTYKAEIDTDKMSYVKDGYWYIGGVKTDYKAVGNTAVKGTDGVWTLCVPGEDGAIQEVKLPSAASKITSIEVIDDAKGYAKYLSLDNTTFTYSGSTDEEWGGKELPANNSCIIASSNKVLLQISPAEAASNIQKITLVNSKGEALGIDLKAEAYTGLLTRADAADVVANGLYELSVPAQTVTKEEYELIKAALKGDGEDGSAMFGFAADGVLRSDYDYATAADGEKGDNAITETTEISYYDGGSSTDTDDALLYIKPFSGGAKIVLGSEEASSMGTVKIGVANTIGFSNSYIYDAYLTFADDDIEAYGITYDKEKAPLTFTVGKLAEEGGPTINFTLTTVDVCGKVKTTNLKAKIAVEGADITIEDEEVGVIDLANKDTWKIILNLDKFGINTDFWKNNCTEVAVDGLYSDDACEEGIESGVTFTPFLSTALQERKPAKEATQITVNIGWSVNDVELFANTQYYLKLVSKSSDGAEIGTIIVPVKFKAPTPMDLLKSYIADKKYILSDGSIYINAYDIKNGNSVELIDYFKNLGYSSPNYELGGTAISVWLDGTWDVAKDANGEKVASDDVASLSGNTIKLNNDAKYMIPVSEDGTTPFITSNNGKIYAGYGADLIVRVKVGDSYLGFKYATGEKEASFKVCIKSPIASGTVKLDESVKLKWSELTKGEAKITSDQLKGYKADGSTFDVFATSEGSDTMYAESTSYASGISSIAYQNGDKIELTGAGTMGEDEGSIKQTTGVYHILKSVDGGGSRYGYLQFKNKGDIPSGSVTDTIVLTISDSNGYTRYFAVEVPIGD